MLGRFVCIVYHGMVTPKFEGYFVNNYDIHEHNDRISEYFCQFLRICINQV